jgi:hypothetical protein
MNRVLHWSPHLAVILVCASLGLVMNFACSPTRPGHCWVSVDTLYESGVSIGKASDVQAAFEAYVAFVDTTDARFLDEEDWTYITSRPFHKWRGRFYWQVCHEAYSPDLGKRRTHRLVYVDENGVVVWPYGCI